MRRSRSASTARRLFWSVLAALVLTTGPARAGTVVFAAESPGVQARFPDGDVGTVRVEGQPGNGFVVHVARGGTDVLTIAVAAPYGFGARLVPGTYLGIGSNATDTAPGVSIGSFGISLCEGVYFTPTRLDLRDLTRDGVDSAVSAVVADIEGTCSRFGGDPSPSAFRAAIRFDAGDDACARVPDGTACDDRDACTAGDACRDGACRGVPATPSTCDVSDQCSYAPVCDPGTGTCTPAHKPDGAFCDDLDGTTGPDACRGGVCTPGPAIVDCNDDDPCTYDARNPDGSCMHNPIGSCWRIHGTVSVARRQGRARAVQRRPFKAALVFLPSESRYLVPAASPCWSSTAAMLAETGTFATASETRRGSVMRLTPDSLGTLGAALATCDGLPAPVLRAYRSGSQSYEHLVAIPGTKSHLCPKRLTRIRPPICGRIALQASDPVDGEVRVVWQYSGSQHP